MYTTRQVMQYRSRRARLVGLLLAAILAAWLLWPSRTVWMTGRGQKYHIEDCRYIQTAGDEASRVTVRHARRYDFGPCKVCRP